MRAPLIWVWVLAMGSCHAAAKVVPRPVRNPAAFTDAAHEKPGTRRHLTLADLPEPEFAESVQNGPSMAPRPAKAWPLAPEGFRVELYAAGLDNPRLLRVAPNGDLFLAESGSGKVKVFRGTAVDGKAELTSVFASGLSLPFGMAFYPPGPKPSWLYVANTGSVVRFAYASGDLQARSAPEVVVPDIPGGGHLTGGGHWTRDLAFSLDGKTMFVSVGSHSNVDDTDDHPVEKDRADILSFNPDGTGRSVYAWGIRNAVGIAVHPESGVLWCSTNERDGMGDDLPPDYITHVTPGGFYGWPWYYIGGHQDPRHAGKHPELKDRVIVPDVLLQPHFASLQMAFYEASQFPKEFHGDAFAAEHGSWNRDQRTGYEVIRIPFKGTEATGEYEDFLTGFTLDDGRVWGRPVGVAVAADGSLFVSDDGSRSIWRVRYVGRQSR